jgi:FkbM family methyltransferase
MIKKFTIIMLSIFDMIYQKKIINFFKYQKIQLDVIIDVGAHKGETIKLFLKNFYPKKIISFEASNINFEYLLNKNHIYKKKYPNTDLIIENKALGDKNDLREFKQMKESSSSTFAKINLDSSYLKKKKFFLGIKNNKDLFDIKKIQIITLSDYFKINDLRRIDLLKIDTEGFEFEILKGADNKLKICNFILFEHHYDNMIKKTYTFTDINNFLVSKNFKLEFKSKMPFRKTFEYIYKNQNQLN